jgi:hypothetical protein
MLQCKVRETYALVMPLKALVLTVMAQTDR